MLRRPPSRAAVVLLGALAAALAAGGCDRRIEPFDPAEKPAEPNLTKIFPAETLANDPRPELPPPPGGRGAPPVAAAAESAEPIRGRVVLGPGLEGKVPSGAILFVIARRGGAGPPLAVLRIPDPSFPLDFEIGPDDRMIQQLPFVGPVRISARLDGDGNASTREAGDLEGLAEGEYPPGATDVRVALRRALPEEE